MTEPRRPAARSRRTSALKGVTTGWLTVDEPVVTSFPRPAD